MAPVRLTYKAVRPLGHGGDSGGGAEGLVDVKNGKLVRVRPMRYGWKQDENNVCSGQGA